MGWIEREGDRVGLARAIAYREGVLGREPGRPGIIARPRKHRLTSRSTPSRAHICLLYGQDGDTPILKASESGHTKVVRLLLDSKADANLAKKVAGTYQS